MPLWTENTLLVFRFVKTHSGLTETEIKEQFGIREASCRSHVSREDC